MTPVDLEEGGAFAYLRVLASPLVCSEIARLTPAQHTGGCPWGTPLAFSDSDTHTGQHHAELGGHGVAPWAFLLQDPAGFPVPEW